MIFLEGLNLSLYKTRVPVRKILAALTLMIAPAAFASTSTLPAACLTYLVSADVNNGDQVVNCSATAGSYGSGGTAVLSLSPDPAVTAMASTAPQAVGRIASSEAVIQYYIEFSGPTASVPIQVNATVSALGDKASGLLLISDTQQAAAYLRLEASTGGAGAGVTGSSPCSGNTNGQGADCAASYVPGTPVSNNLTWVANTNTVYEVELMATAQNNGAGTSAVAYVDPTFSIASSIANLQAYSILLSNGIGNSPASNAAPEPTTAALLVSSIGVITCFIRRKLKR